MDKKIKYYLIVLLGFINPLTIYWYYSFYRAFLESASALFFCLTVSLVIFYRVRINFNNSNTIYSFVEMFLLSFLASLLWLVLSQLIFSEKVFGLELGERLLYIFGGLGLYSPLVWLNSLIFIVLFIFARKR